MIDLYDKTKKLLREAQIPIYREAVEALSVENEVYTLRTANQVHQATYIFDSRPPLFNNKHANEVSFIQSFYGLHISCDNDVFQKDTFEMMNFNIDQQGSTQFIYVIPFSSKDALVELTRFGEDKIDFDEASNMLNSYIRQEFGSYQQLGSESGCIPMTTHLNPPSAFERILKTGTAANLIKPSTGYGFKNMFLFAELVAGRVATNDYKNFNTLSLPSKPRFKFYDRLLLTILLLWPSRGKEIFSRLFGSVDPLKIFSFLEEKSSWRDELQIFASLPFKPFLLALKVYLKSRISLRYVFAAFTVLLYQVIDLYSYEVATYFSYALLFVGMLWLGIPHGALDHLLSKNNKSPIVIFIIKYLIIMALYLLFWQVFPGLSLLIFVVYASFHFGESELIQDKQQVKSFRGYINSILMGLSILLFITTTHWDESLHIISIITDAELNTEQATRSNSWIVVVSCISFVYVLAQRLLSKRQSHTALLFLLALGFFSPLLLAFGLYFILQHSHNAWSHLKFGLGMSSFELYKKSSVFTVGAVAIFLFIAFFVRSSSNFEGLWANFFIFIACISLPHFVLMHLFYVSIRSF